MLLLKCVFFCWLVATCFGQGDVSSTKSPTTTSTTDTPTTTTVVTTTNSPTTTTMTDTPTTTPVVTTTNSPTTTTTTDTPTTTPVVTTTNSPTTTSTTDTPTTTTAVTTTNSPTTTSTTDTPTTTTAVTTTNSPTTTSTTDTATTTTAVTTTNSPTTTPMTDTPTTTTDVTTTNSPTTTSMTDTTKTNPDVSTSPTMSTTQTTEVTSITSKPSETTATTGQESSSTPSSTSTVTITTKPPACSSNPCPIESDCIESFDGFTCQCFAGSFFSEGSCSKAKVFAGDLRLMKETFVTEMENTASEEFQKTANLIQTMLDVALKSNDTDYIKSTVRKLRSGSVIASVDNVYKTTSTMTEASFKSTLKAAVEACGDNCTVLQNSEFTSVSLCEQKPARCDLSTTTCESRDGDSSCPCIPGYIKSTISDRFCLACPSGQKADKDACIKCPFGYSGFNCDDSSLLAVVVISCVLGGVLLITVIAFIIFGCRTKPKDYSSPYPPAQETRTTFTNSNVPKIPRASANVYNQWDNPSNLEMMENGSTRALVGKERPPGNGVMGPYGDMRSFTGNNPSRSYADHGRDNPRFIADDERGTR